jgi:histone-lysine N-methyltransferase SUV420H
VIKRLDLCAAAGYLVELRGLRVLVESLTTAEKRRYFLGLLHLYLSMYRTDCRYEVVSTTRYTGSTQEAAIIARALIPGRATITYLGGVLLSLTPDELERLTKSLRDFSVVSSSYRRFASSQIFLGPGRFVNHDCQPNAELCHTRSNEIVIVALRDIVIGEEITINYGPASPFPTLLFLSAPRDTPGYW